MFSLCCDEFCARSHDRGVEGSSGGRAARVSALAVDKDGQTAEQIAAAAGHADLGASVFAKTPEIISE